LDEEKYYLYRTGFPGVRGGIGADIVSSDKNSYVKQMVDIPFGHPRMIKSYQTEVLSLDISGQQQFYFENYLNVVRLKKGT